MQRISLRHQVAGGVTLLLVSLWSFVVWDAHQAEERELESVRRETAELTLLFANHADNTFRRVDFLLRDMRRAWLVSPSEIGSEVQSHQAELEDVVVQVGTVGADGFLTYSNLGMPEAPLYLGDREHVQVHLTGGGDRLFIGRPVKGRVSGKWSIQLSRPVLRDGKLLGVVVASVNPHYFVRFYRDTGLSAEGAARMVRDTGEIMARSSGQDQYLSRSVSTAPFTAAGASVQGSFRRRSGLDGVDRISSYRRMPEYGVTVLIAESVAARLLPVRDALRQQHMMAAALSLLLILSAWQTLRSNEHRQHEQRRQQHRNRVLQLLASKAPLATLLKSIVADIEALRPGVHCTIVLHDEASTPKRHSDPPTAQTTGWSCPILGGTGEVLGTLAVTWREAHTPSEYERRWLGDEALLTALVLEKHRADEALATNEERLRQAVDGAGLAIWEYDFHTRCHSASPQLLIITGAGSPSEAGYTAQPELLAHMTGASRSALEQAYADMALGRIVSYEAEQQWTHPEDGRAVWLLTRARVVGHGDDGRVRRVLAISMDITGRKAAERKLTLAAKVFTEAAEAIMIADARANIVDVNAAFTAITGYTADEVRGRNPRLLSSGRQGQEFYAAMWQELNTKGRWSGEIWNRRKSGEVYAELLSISMLSDENGVPNHYVSLFSDITAFKEYELKLERIAHYDVLTGLPNRILLGDRLRQAMAQALRRGQPLALVYLDLDGFKAVNDQHGHQAGDRLLSALAMRMKHVLREGDTLARLGGDEFVAVLSDLENREASLPMLNRLLVSASQSVVLVEQTLQVSASLGVAFYPQPEEVDADQLLRQADQAMYQAKLAGKNRYHIFDNEHDRNLRGHHEAIERIRQAMDDREFVMHYQPKVNMRSGEVLGAEALIRWQHPERGLLLPAQFLPVIEDHPLIVALGEWTVQQVLTQMDQWQQSGLKLRVSVNIAARHLQQAHFGERLRAILAEYPDVAPQSLELEVLETSALDDMAHVSQVMQACGNLGVAFALDDFGTGYSSLSYLKQLPAQVLKIDQSFVRDMLDDPDDLAILEGVLGLARAFRRQAIAEGVETQEHGEMLLMLGCEWGQGYGIARPMPAENVRAWVETWVPPGVWQTRQAVGREELALLYAAVEHRAWVADVDAYLHERRAKSPGLDQNECRLGRWLQEYPDAANSPDLTQLLQTHERVHTRVAELLALHSGGAPEQARGALPGLYDLRDELVRALREWRKP